VIRAGRGVLYRLHLTGQGVDPPALRNSRNLRLAKGVAFDGQ